MSDSMGFGFEIAEGVTAVYHGDDDVPATTQNVLEKISDLSSQIVELESLSEEPRLVAHLSEARFSLSQAASSVMQALDYQCTLATPPENIRGRPGPDRDMMYRCFHQPSHCWDRTWKYMSCPP
jgi:hypothetical protein